MRSGNFYSFERTRRQSNRKGDGDTSEEPRSSSARLDLGVGVEAAVSAATSRRMIKGRPPRLGQNFQSYDPPLFFVTICTIHRHKIGDLEAAHRAFEAYIRRAYDEFGVAVGRYVVMPDHMHLFVRGGHDFKLAQWVNGLKRPISVALRATIKRPLWQPGFFDHVLRNDESYSQKWAYVWENPVRAGLVTRADQWPFQGEFVVIDRA